MDFALSHYLEADPYSLSKAEKSRLFLERVGELHAHHLAHCADYARIVQKLGMTAGKSLEEMPFLPARLFKTRELKSVGDSEVSRVITSSGTTGQTPAKIYLDKEASFLQIRVLSAIISSFIGKKRLPLILLDTDNIRRDPALYAVRGAGLSGFSMFSRDQIYALDKNMELKLPEIEDFLQKHKDTPILMTGYTYIIWEYVLKKLRDKNISLNIPNGYLFHGGGWKKLRDKSVDDAAFNDSLHAWMGNIHNHNYYGMAEQLGSIFACCEYGNMHCSNFSDIIIRRPKDFSRAYIGEKGLIQLLSLLPKSYPGFSILTEDEGEILGEDDCPCKRMGKYFRIYGRIKNAEIRGCGDTHERN